MDDRISPTGYTFQSRLAGFLFSGAVGGNPALLVIPMFQSRLAGFLFSGAIVLIAMFVAFGFQSRLAGFLFSGAEEHSDNRAGKIVRFSPGWRDFCFLARARAYQAMVEKHATFQSRLAGFLFSGPGH